MAALKEISSKKLFGGQQKIFSHLSESCKSTMTFAIYIPPAVTEGTVSKVPVLYYLGGLMSTVEKNVATSHYQQYAAQHNLVVVSPDASPRDTGLPGESNSDVMYGHGAGWYLDATTPGWRDHYNMFTYVTDELISVVEGNFDFVLAGRRGIAGDSMGGHGSLLCALKKPDLYQSVSAIFPASVLSTLNKQGLPLVSKYFPVADKDKDRKSVLEVYLGTDEEAWKEWDISELMKVYKGPPLDFIVHATSCDTLWHLLKPWKLVEAIHGKDNINMNMKIIGGYDHDSYFKATVMGEVISYHVNILNG